MAYPLRHISLRVPWHDTAWDGRVCANPRLNSSCLKLRRIAEGRNDAAEEKIKGELLSDLSEDEWPCCIGERVSFLAPFELNRTINHPYNRGPETAHGHFDDTPLRQPPYSAPAIPFRWVLRDNMRALGEEHALDVQEEREPDLGDFGETWVQDRDNQKALLDCFADHLKPEILSASSTQSKFLSSKTQAALAFSLAWAVSCTSRRRRSTATRPKLSRASFAQ